MQSKELFKREINRNVSAVILLGLTLLTGFIYYAAREALAVGKNLSLDSYDEAAILEAGYLEEDILDSL